MKQETTKKRGRKAKPSVSKEDPPPVVFKFGDRVKVREDVPLFGGAEGIVVDLVESMAGEAATSPFSYMNDRVVVAIYYWNTNTKRVFPLAVLEKKNVTLPEA